MKRSVGTPGEALDGAVLFPQHLEMLRASAISDEVVRQRGYRTVTTKAELLGLGFGRYQARGSL